MSARPVAKVGLCVAAGLSGAAGMGLEVLLISLSGLVVGQGRAGALGIALYLAGWACGARFSAGIRRPRLALGLAGSAVMLAAFLGPRLLVATGAASPALPLAFAAAGLALLAAAVPQGVFLPLLARPFEGGGRLGLAPIVAANLFGAALGAQLFGERAPAELGLLHAAGLAGACAGVAALFGVACWARSYTTGASHACERDATAGGSLTPRSAGLLLSLFVGWGAGVQLVGLRLGVLWLGGMQAALGAVLAASLLALTLGAALLTALLPRGRTGLVLLFALCLIAPLSAFVPDLFVGALPKDAPPLLRALLLVGPMLLPFGAALPVLHRELSRRGDGSLGRLLGYEALGALIGIPLTQALFVPYLGLGGTLGAWAGIAAIACARLGRGRGAPYYAVAATGALIAGLSIASLLGQPALSSPPLRNPALEILAFDEDEHFAVSVVEDGLHGERTLMTDGFRAAGTGEDYRYMRALGHLPLLLHPAPERVCVLAFGTGTTAGAVSLHTEVRELELLELSGTVIDDAPWFEEVNRGVLDDAEGRVRVTLGDGRRTLAEREGAYDVLTMEPLLPSSPFGVYLYTKEFYERARGALAEGGLLCQWVPTHALEPEVFQAVIDSFTAAFEWSGLFLSGSQLLLVGGAECPELDPDRFPSADSKLFTALAALGLERPEGVAARFITEADGMEPVERPLTDADPWVVYLPQPRGARVLSLLPENLAWLRGHESDPPAAWTAGSSPAALARIEGVAAARRAREAFAVRGAERSGVMIELSGLVRELSGELTEALRLAPRDAGVQALALEIELATARRDGILRLATRPGVNAARAALPDLVRAVELRPKRADGHLYLSVALERAGDLSNAKSALKRALELCPRLAETRPAEQARRLGFPATPELQALWDWAP